MTTRRFACTACGKCCNRAPELELGEAAAYADTFVLQLLMRIYSLPRSFSDYASDLPREEASAEYYESKRLLAQFAADSWPIKAARGARAVDYVQYLSLSVLPLDLGGACPALEGTRCGIYDRRPLSCRSVPLHYSRPEAAAARDLDAFVATPGFACAIGVDAPIAIEAGKIVDTAMISARTAARERADSDRRWKAALVRAMKAREHDLPSPRDVEAQAARGALTASMVAVWHTGEAAGALAEGDGVRLLGVQLELIDRVLLVENRAEIATSLAQLRREYAATLAK